MHLAHCTVNDPVNQVVIDRKPETSR
jgi:hypothetical protein